jgi:hypothetical protein
MSITSRALAFASLWFDAATVDRVFAPLVADWQREWRDATPARRASVYVRGLAAFAFSFVILTPRILATPTPSRIRVIVTARIAAFCLVAGGVLCVPFVQAIAKQSMEPLSLPLLVIFALPAALTIAFPFAMTIAVDGIRRDRHWPAQVERAAALKLAATAFVVMMLASGFLVPAANQLWRERSTPVGWNVPGPPISQSSTLALLTHPDRNGPIVPRQYTRAGEIRRELVSRVVMSILPAILIWLRWEATNRRRRAWYAPLPGVLATTGGIIAFFAFWGVGAQLELRGILPWALGQWTPVVGLLGSGLVLRAWSRRLETRLPQNSRIA